MKVVIFLTLMMMLAIQLATIAANEATTAKSDVTTAKASSSEKAEASPVKFDSDSKEDNGSSTIDQTCFYLVVAVPALLAAVRF